MTRALAITAIFKKDFSVGRLSGVKHQADIALSTLFTDGKDRTSLDDVLIVCTVENTPLKNGDIPYVHVCTKCVEKKQRNGSSSKHPIKKEETDLVQYSRKSATRQRWNTDYRNIHRRAGEWLTLSQNYDGSQNKRVKILLWPQQTSSPNIE